MTGTLTIAHLTLAEARRRRIVTAALLCAAAFLAVFSAAVFFAYADMKTRANQSFVERQAILTLLTLVGLYAANFLSVLFAVLLPIDALSGEIDSGVIQTIACKPVHRAAILAGKWLGHSVIALGYLTALAAGVLMSLRLLAGFAPLHLGQALPLMALEVVLLVTVSIAGGTRLSTVTNGVLALGFYGVAFIGGWVEQVGVLADIESARMIGIATSLISPPDALWRLAAHYLQPAIVREIGPNALFSASVPTPLMVWWAAGFIVLTFAYAARSFARRPL